MEASKYYKPKKERLFEESPKQRQRIFAYVDGFNLYHGIKECKDNCLKWLDLRKFIEYILNLEESKNTYSIEGIKYFTARSYDEESRKRQEIYLKTIENEKIEIIYGKFIRTWKGANTRYEEKATDVNIVCNILEDSYEDRYDTALIVSGDGDIVPALEIIKNKYRRKIIVAHPPHRKSFYMEKTAHKNFYSTKRHVKKCLLPDIMVIKGKKIEKPEKWG